MFSFNDNRKTVNEIFTMFDEGKLIVDDTYQRRSVWSEKDKVRLIETILLQLVIPELFFWKADTDPETGVSTTHIVDGQQRIKAIYSFINNEFKLKPQYLLDGSIKAEYSNKYFKDLDAETRKAFWNYQLMIIEIDSKATRDDIITMFNRLNLTDYSLNDQEKRNSVSGEFAALARELSDNPLWDEKRLFTGPDVKRMKDVEFCASIVLLYRKGIIDQTDQSALNQAYEELQIGYKDAERDKEAVCAAIETISLFFVSDSVTKFLRRKAQLYTLFSVVFYMQRENIEIEQCQKDHLESFVKLYSIFDNDMDLTGEISDQEKTLFDWLKKYKLASSEGLNKHTNRMIRYNVMKDFLFGLTDELEAAQLTLYEKMQANSTVVVKEDPED
ncbi:DUF262 domain-containing protein [Solibaculum intestinale]|uniref:DUF262 domain-containing protein n=1 Tax=Solibaculum intestinale TaxID=3133165 RepID=A0ABV1E294_9FIRM